MAYLLGEKSRAFIEDSMRRGADLRSRRRAPPRGGVADESSADPHLVVRVNTVQVNPVAPAQAWKLDGEVVPNTVVSGVRVYAMAMADNDGPYSVVGRGMCIAHRVRGVAGEIREGV